MSNTNYGNFAQKLRKFRPEATEILPGSYRNFARKLRKFRLEATEFKADQRKLRHLGFPPGIFRNLGFSGRGAKNTDEEIPKSRPRLERFVCLHTGFWA
jgi:hypothetical protein